MAFLSDLQISEFEDTVVTIAYQNDPGQYSIKEDLYDDWPFDVMNVVIVKFAKNAAFGIYQPEAKSQEHERTYLPLVKGYTVDVDTHRNLNRI